MTFCPENVVCLMCLLHKFKCTTDYLFTMEANTINPDQTATGFILFAIKTNKIHKQKREQTTMVMNGGKRVKL